MSYRQSSYELPYSGAVPGGGSAMSDDFSLGSPQLYAAGDPLQPVPGYAALGSHWQTGNIGSLSASFAVNTRVRAAELGLVLSWSDPGAAWITQPLPALIPGVPHECVIYARTSLGPVQPQVIAPPEPPPLTRDAWLQPWAYLTHGLFIGPGTPEDGAGFLLGTESGWSDWDPYIVSGMWDVDSLAKVSQYFWFTEGTRFEYYRIRLSQTLISPTDVRVRASFELGTTGADWFVLEQFELVDLAEYAQFKRVGFMLSGMAQGVEEQGSIDARALCDFVRVVEQPFGDLSSSLGGRQLLGVP